jgi:ribosomal protein L3 glutamine methyltransferase
MGEKYITYNMLPQRINKQQELDILTLFDVRINTRKPLAYILKEINFAGYNFYVDERVIIPRSPIAELILSEFSPWIGNASINRILDLCTGSGCIAISCAKKIPNIQVDATDISLDALDVAKINVEKHAVEKRVNLIQSDMFNEIQHTYDIIIANPPYVPKEEYVSLPEEFKHEPEIALTDNHDGLKFADIILNKSCNYLNENGILILETGNSAYALENKYANVPFMWLEFVNGGMGICIFTKNELKKYFSTL